MRGEGYTTIEYAARVPYHNPAYAHSMPPECPETRRNTSVAPPNIAPRGMRPSHHSQPTPGGTVYPLSGVGGANMGPNS